MYFFILTDSCLTYISDAFDLYDLYDQLSELVVACKILYIHVE